MLQKFKHLKLSVQITILSVLTLFVFLLFVASFTKKTEDVFSQTNEYYTNEIIYQLEQTIYSNYTSLANIIRFISFQSDIQNFLIETNAPSKYELYKQMQNDLMSAVGLNSQILDIIITDGEHKTYNLTNAEYILPPCDKEASGITTSPLYHDSTMNHDYFIMYAPIYSTSSMQRTNDAIGSIYLILGRNAFTEGNSQSFLQAKSKIYLSDSSGELFWSNNTAQYPLLKNLNTKDYKITPLSDIGLDIISIIEKEETIYAILNTQMKYYILLCFILLVLILVWTDFIHKLVKPMNQLVSFITSIKEGVLKDLNKRIGLKGYYEIEIISSEFNGMLETIDNLTHQLFKTTSQLYEAKLLKNQAELQYLRSQINPHFLYNTLESIKGIAAEHQEPKIVSITKSLATIFKYSVKGSSEVTLRDELKIITNYISIQLLRFEGRFHVDYDIKEECLSCIVPKMILQPIIENAMVHGVELMNTNAQLLVKASKNQSGELEILVFNESPRIEPKQLLKIQSSLAAFDIMASDGETKSIGIYNVNSRIKLSCGAQYGLRLENDVHGTTVILQLPMRH